MRFVDGVAATAAAEGTSSARGRARVVSLARAIWIDGKTLRDAPLVGHRGFVV